MLKTPIGDVKGFAIELLKHIIYIIGIGYMGGSITALASLSTISMNELFPLEINALPYKSSNPCSVATLKGDGLYEYLFPMKHLGFPYKQQYPITNKESLIHDIINWFIFTCAHAFILFRYCYKIFIDICSYLNKNIITDLVLFYLIPYVWISVTMYLSFMIGIAGIAYGALTDEGWIFAFSPFLLWFYKFSQCKQIDFSCILMMFLYQIPGFFLPLLFIPWWICILIAIVAYAVVVLLFSPFLYKDGIQSVVKQILIHKTSLIILFMFLTLKTSSDYLIPPVTVGLLIGAIYVLYGLYKSSLKKK